MPDPANGMQTALREAMDERAEADAAAEPAQAFLPLLPADQLADLPEGSEAARRAAIAAAPRRPGRPQGAKNKSTEAMRRHFLSRFQSPLIFLGEVYSRPVDVLAAELGCTKLEAFDRQVRAAAEVAPYVHGKMPVEVAVSADLPTLILADPSRFFGGAGNEGNQGFNLLDLEPVGQPELDNAAETEDSCGSCDAAPLIADQRPEAAGGDDPAAEGGS